jgi:hypothetical protein
VQQFTAGEAEAELLTVGQVGRQALRASAVLEQGEPDVDKPCHIVGVRGDGSGVWGVVVVMGPRLRLGRQQVQDRLSMRDNARA